MLQPFTALLLLMTAAFGSSIELFNWNCIEKSCAELTDEHKICEILKLCSCVNHVDSCKNYYNANSEVQDKIVLLTKISAILPYPQLNDPKKVILKFYINLLATERTTGTVRLHGRCSRFNQSNTNENNSDNDLMESGHLNITGIQRNRNISELELGWNCITKFSGSFSEAFPRLTRLQVEYNKLNYLSKTTLKGLKFLLFLYLSNNLLNMIDDEAFKDLQNLDSLNLSFNELTTLPSTLFDHTPRLTKLAISNNYLKTLPETIFQFLNNLKYLWLESNRLEKIPSNIFQNQNNLLGIHLASNKLKYIDENWFVELHLLKALVMRNNSVEVPPTTTCFQHLNTFIILDLSLNQLKEIPELIFSSLVSPKEFEKIDISNNNISAMELPLRNRLKNSKWINLSNNCFIDFNISTPEITKTIETGYEQLNCTNCCLTKIYQEMLEDVSEIADLKYNSISALTEDDFNAIPDGITVDLSNNNISKVNVNAVQYSRKNQNPKKVSVLLNFNPFLCDCSLLPFVQSLEIERGEYWMQFPTVKVNILMNNLFCEYPALMKSRRVISLKNEELLCDIDHKDGCPKTCHCHNRPSDNTVIIDCSDQLLQIFPALDKRLFKHSIILNLENNSIETIPELDDDFWFALTQLHLSHNQLKNVENLKFGRQLTALSIDHNRLQKLDSSLVSILSSNLNVNLKLSENPWSCDCEFKSQRSLIYSKNVLDINDIKCDYEDGNEVKYVLMTELSDEDMCPLAISLENLKIMKISIPVALILVILITTSFVLFRRYQSQIKLWLFVHGICLKLVSEDDIDADKIYDAFVSYSSKDEEWVVEVLIKGLEEGTPAYRLCLHERDWIGGEWIPNQIARSVEQSRRTIIVLTKNFVESYWSQIEFYTAYENTVKNNLNRLIVVVPGEVPEFKTTDKELKNFISMNTYLQWDKPNFWNKLRCAMPRVRYQTDIELRQISL